MKFEVRVDDDDEQVKAVKQVHWGREQIGGWTVESRRQGRGNRDGVGHKQGIYCNDGKVES